MSPKIAIITDTDSSLPEDLAARYNILQVPITIHFNDQTYTSGVDIDDRSLFEIVDRVNKLPSTSAPAPSAFAGAYEQAFQQGADTVVCVCVSSKISSTYNSALTACESFAGRDIRVVDSLNLSMGQGFMALAAAQAAENGAGAAEVVDAANNTGKRLHLYAVLATLKYLSLSGRVGKLAAGMADTFNIKPILTARDGQLILLDKVRTRAKALARMNDLVRANVQDKGIQQIAVIHVNHPEGAAELSEQYSRDYPGAGDILIAEFGPGLSVHAGSGVVGVVVVEKE
jgi:DegV family protein with EDD domain